MPTLMKVEIRNYRGVRSWLETAAATTYRVGRHAYSIRILSVLNEKLAVGRNGKMERLSKLLRSKPSVALMQIRTLIKDPPLPEEGGIKYHGFTYYPRNPDFKDPPYEPTKLFLIRRLCKMSGLNPVERRTLEILNIDGLVRFQQHVSIVKNIPEVNSYLWKVKHLIKITPIRFVKGLPKDGDYTGTFLRDNGEFIISEKVKVDESRLVATENFLNDKKKLDFNYMKGYLRRRWENQFTGDI